MLLLLPDFHPQILLQRNVRLLEELVDRALELLGVEEVLIEQRLLLEEGIQFSLGDFFGDVLWLAGGFGLFDRERALFLDDRWIEVIALQRERAGEGDVAADVGDQL